MLSMIVAHDENRLIGNENKLPWKIPGELKYFKEITIGKKVVMGRKTFDSIGKPLIHRDNLVLSKDVKLMIPGCEVTNPYRIIRECVLGDEDKETIIIGGSSVYEFFLPFVNKIYVTIVKGSFEGDSYFPEYEKDFYQESCSDWIEENEYKYKKCIYIRKAA